MADPTFVPTGSMIPKGSRIDSDKKRQVYDKLQPFDSLSLEDFPFSESAPPTLFHKPEFYLIDERCYLHTTPYDPVTPIEEAFDTNPYDARFKEYVFYGLHECGKFPPLRGDQSGSRCRLGLARSRRGIRDDLDVARLWRFRAPATGGTQGRHDHVCAPPSGGEEAPRRDDGRRAAIQEAHGRGPEAIRHWRLRASSEASFGLTIAFLRAASNSNTCAVVSD